MDTQKIVVVEINETIEDKLKQFADLEDPQIFVRITDERDALDIKYTFVNSVDKLLRVINETDIYVMDGETIVNSSNAVPFMTNAQGPLRAKVGQFAISVVHTMKRDPYIPSMARFYAKNDHYKPLQFDQLIGGTPEELYRRVYEPRVADRWIDHILSDKYHQDPQIIIEVPEVNFPTVPEFIESYKYISNIFGLSPWCCRVFLNFSRKNYIDIMLGKSVDKFIDFYENIREIVDIMQYNKQMLTWDSIRWWIKTELKLESTNFSAMDLKVIKKRRHKIIEKFLTEPCEHMDNPSIKHGNLKLDGNFYICSHGNKIICRHKIQNRMTNEELEQFYVEFGEEIQAYTLFCKFCGEELMRNPNIRTHGFDINIANRGFDDDLRKYTFKKCIMMLSQVEFKIIISSEFAQRVAGTMASSIISHISTEFDRLDKMRGFKDDIIESMKEIIAYIYAYCSLVLLTMKNKDIMKINGTRGTETLTDYIKLSAKKLEYILSIHMSRIKNFKSINLIDTTQAVMQELSKSAYIISPNTERLTIKDNAIYIYFSRFMKVENFPNIVPPKMGDYRDLINNQLIDLAKMPFTVDNKSKDFIDYIEKYNQLKKQELEIKSLNAMPWHDYIPPVLPIVAPPLNGLYLGYFYSDKGGIHRHQFTSGKLANGKIVKYNEIAADQYIVDICCTICGESGKPQDLSEKITKQLLLQSKNNYFKYYCPEQTYHQFKNGHCTFCGYVENGDNSKYFEKHNLPQPPKNEQVKIDYKPTYIEDMKKTIEQDAKYYGTMSKNDYKNFWINLCAYEDVTFKELLGGKQGDRNIAIPKLLSQYLWLSQLLSNIVNLSNRPNKNLMPYAGEEKLLLQLITELNNVRRGNYQFDYDNLRINFINVFNKLPKKLAEFVVRELIRLCELSAKSEEKSHVEALIAHKNVYNEEGIDIDKGDEKKNEEGAENLFTYDGADYDGRNDGEEDD